MRLMCFALFVLCLTIFFEREAHAACWYLQDDYYSTGDLDMFEEDSHKEPDTFCEDWSLFAIQDSSLLRENQSGFSVTRFHTV
jgi:hypothetical protein